MTDSPATETKHLLLVDISSYFFRAFHAIRELRSPAGEPTNAIFGVVNMLRKLREEHPHDYSAAVFDPKGKTFRDDIYPEYKATSSATPEELAFQIPLIRETVEALGWQCVVVDGFEADDVIGTLARHASARGVKTMISTGDKDLAQLVNDQVTLVNTMSNETLDIEGVKNKFGVPPDRIIDYLALMGDTVDNVPGVDKVGPKTAAKWIAEYGSLAEVMARAEEIKGVVGENLRKALPWLPTGRELVTVKCDVPLPFEFDALAFKAADTEKLAQLYERFGFKGLRNSLKGANAPTEHVILSASEESHPHKQAEKDATASRWSSGEPATKQTPFIATRQY
ncbi:MAG: DNA polymerase I, partial [Betaproteobacteria bacterium]|nr:DNA polymerase I [Betaproteobacteria bacterium]